MGDWAGASLLHNSIGLGLGLALPYNCMAVYIESAFTFCPVEYVRSTEQTIRTTEQTIRTTEQTILNKLSWKSTETYLEAPDCS